ncbi:triacylglycerol lipase [Granulicatella adiacens]|uniref:triacylglycerol lipase n=1 Tax=Granulicatella adiacens TaxID=46124 RepID=UPI00352EF00E
MNRIYTDLQNKIISEAEYDKSLKVGSPINVPDGNNEITVGIVKEIFHDISGLDGYVVENVETKEVIVLFQGSKQPFSLGGLIDWGLNDIPMAVNIFLQFQAATPQLYAAAKKLNQILIDYPEAQISLYTHSLGTMAAEFALANVTDPSRIKEAHMYQGPNIYRQLTDAQKKTVDLLKYRIHNYVDDMDIVAFGYPTSGSENSVGIVHHVDANPVNNFISQHLWGGYVFDKDGKLREKEGTTDIERRYAISRDLMRMGMYRFSLLKRKLTLNGLTGSEKIFLDSEHAQVILSSLTKASQVATEELKKIYLESILEAEEIMTSTYIVPFGYSLSPEEVAGAYRQGGVTRHNIVNDIVETVKLYKDTGDMLSTEFKELESEINLGIQELLNHDAQLAGEFNQWKKMN